jgi:putative ATPase
MDLFDAGMAGDMLHAPLADRMRPRRLEDVVGQDHVVGRDSVLCRSIANDRLFSIILWGPPGCGKTTIAGIIARETRSHFVEISAVLSGVKEIRKVIDAAREQRRLHARRTILFVDEIHRFNKAQQDAFLHHVEKGLIVLVGATTENPSFEVIPALVSRCRVVPLKRLDGEQLRLVLERALADRDRGLGDMNLDVSRDALDHIAWASDGDVRIALTNLEAAAGFARRVTPDLGNDDTPGRGPGPRPMRVTLAEVEQAVQKKALRYDKGGDQHFNLISAFHKSLRGSDPDGALYWLTRMISAGEDPLYVLRRMVRFAVEDVGMADPGALTVALNALEAFRFLGHPEGDDTLVQAAIYLATAPKSNRVYMAGKAVRQEVEKTGYLPVPLHIRNAPTSLMKEQGCHAGYKYAHDYPDGYVPQEYLPRELQGRFFYDPTARGYEATVKNRLDAWRRIHKRDGRKEKE